MRLAILAAFAAVIPLRPVRTAPLLIETAAAPVIVETAVDAGDDADLPPAHAASVPPAHAASVPPAHAASVPPARRQINPHEAVMRFCGWMRDWGFSGWHPADDIVGFYQWFCAEDGLEEMNHDLLRERFASAPGVTRERRRLNDTTDKDLVRVKRRLGGSDRAMLYRVASHEELAEAAAGKKGRKTPLASGRTTKTRAKTVSAPPVRRVVDAPSARRAA